MKRKYFMRRAWLFFWVMLIPTAFLFITFTIISVKNLENELSSKGMQTAQEVKTNLSLVLDNVLLQNNSYIGTPRMSLVLKRALGNNNEMTYTDAVYVTSIQTLITGITNTYTYLDSLYLYLDGADRFFLSNRGITDFSPSVDASWLEYYENMPDVSSYMVLRDLQTNGPGPKSVLTVFQRFLLQKGCVVINIDIKDLQNILKSLLFSTHEAVYVLNSKGEVLVQQGGNENDALIAADTFLQLANEHGDISKALESANGTWIKSQAERFFVNSTHYSQMGISIVSSISSKAQSTALKATIETFLIILLINIGVVMLLAYMTTKRSFDQIYTMLQMFEDSENGLPVKKPEKKVEDEYDVIMNNIIYLFLNSTYLNAQLKEKQFRQENAELMALQLQINPHFLFNTLQTLDMEVRRGRQNSQEISMIIKSVSDILKYSLSNPHESVILQEEIEYLKRYIGIQKFRFGDSFIVYYDVDESVNAVQVFRLMLQPAVENSLLHGLRMYRDKGYIKVKIRRKNNEVCIKIIDNGGGMSKDELLNLRERLNSNEGKSIGLLNINRRLMLRYGEKCRLHIRSKKGVGTCVYFSIPFENAPIL